MSNPVVWKEWREQRMVLLAGLAVSVMLPLFLIGGSAAALGEIDLGAISSAMPIVLAGLVWPLFALATGGSAFAPEFGTGTAGFLLSRPISRRRVWSTKVGVAAFTLASIVMGSLIIFGLFASMTGGEWPSVETQIHYWEMGNLIGLVPLMGLLSVIFASAVFFSTVLKRSLTAAAAGLGSSLAIMGLIFLLWYRLDVVPALEPDLLTVQLIMAVFLILTASRWLFAKSEVIPDARRAALLLPIMIGLIVLTTIPVLLARSTLSPEEAYLEEYSLASGGRVIAATASHLDEGSPRVWLIHTDGAGYEQITPRLTSTPAFSPDGESIAYLSQRDPFGLRSAELSLFITGTDGSDPRRIASGILGDDEFLWAWAYLEFSPDARWVTALTWGASVAVAVDDGRIVNIEKEEDTVLYGWNRDSTEVLLIGDFWSNSSKRIIGFDPSTGKRRTLASLDLDELVSWEEWASDGELIALSNAKGGDSVTRDLILVNLKDGNATLFEQNICTTRSFEHQRERSVMFYAICSGDKKEGYRSDLRVRSLDQAAGKTLAQMEGMVWSVDPSPDGRSVVGRLTGGQEGGEETVTFILDPEGNLRELPPEWHPLGWSGRDRVLVTTRFETPTRIGVVTVGEGAIRTIHPRPTDS